MTEEAHVLKNEITKHVKQKEMLDRRIKDFEAERDANVMEREKLRQMLSSIECDMHALKKDADTDKRQLDNCIREKEILTKNILRHQGRICLLKTLFKNFLQVSYLENFVFLNI